MGSNKGKGAEKPKKGVVPKTPAKSKATPPPAKKAEVKPKKEKVPAGKKKEVGTKSKPAVKASEKQVKKTDHQSASSQKIKLPKPKDVKEANKKLYDVIGGSKPITSKASLTGKKYGSAKTVYSPDKEVVTTTHKENQPLATPKKKKA
jgi:hypothetical protein